MFRRYLEGVEVTCVRNIDQVDAEMSRSPAQALIVNSPTLGRPAALPDQLGALPYHTPTVTCWVPGETSIAQQLHAFRYLVKPVTRDTLLTALDELGEGVRTILLVDDEPEALRLFARMLASAGKEYQVLQTTNGQRALNLLRDRQPDAMILDLVMPGMDGFQVLHAKSHDPSISEIPTIVISARDPTGEPIATDALTVIRNGGLSARDVSECIMAISKVLTPAARLARPEQQESSVE
jgi:CheY-like chemotaxis protein